MLRTPDVKQRRRCSLDEARLSLVNTDYSGLEDI